MVAKVSVIIPSFNHARFLKQRIDSILNQTFQDFELIILDDASSDQSREIIEEYRNNLKVSHIVYNSHNSRSPFSQWERGLLLARGRLVWIAESDDFSDPNFLEVMVKILTENKEAGIAFCNSHWVDENGQCQDDLSIYKQSFIREGHLEIQNSLSKYCSIQNVSACVIRRDLALKSIHGLCNYRSCGDWIFYTRILQHSNLVFHQEKLNYFRWYHNNTSKAAQKENRWITEGIDILTNIDFKKVPLSFRDFGALLVFWTKSIRSVEFNKQSRLFLILSRVLLKYSLSKFKLTS